MELNELIARLTVAREQAQPGVTVNVELSTCCDAVDLQEVQLYRFSEDSGVLQVFLYGDDR